MTPIKVNYSEGKIVLSSAFAKKCFTPCTAEYALLQSVRNDNPGFVLETRQFKTNTKQEHYRGLTYGYMRDYISSHEKAPKPILDELDDQIGISKCHSLHKRYPTIKAWFLKRYPAVAEFGIEPAAQEAEPQKIVDMATLDSSDTEAEVKVPA